MSGLRGCARTGKVKIAVKIEKVGTTKRFTTHLFLPELHSVYDIFVRLLAKYPELNGSMRIVSLHKAKPKYKVISL